MKILMVCLGNICRSPMAEGILRAKTAEAGLAWQIDSAGTESYHVGEPPHKNSILTCKENGIDISQQRARQIQIADFEAYDIIYALANDVYKDIAYFAKDKTNLQKVKLLMDEIAPGQKLSVKDPYYGTKIDYEEVFALLCEVSDVIIQKYSQ